MSDGYKALMREIEKSGTPEILSFDELSSRLEGKALGLDYRDRHGTETRRWVTVRSFEDGNMWAYCWRRGDLRTFDLGRISGVIDRDGEVLHADAVFDGVPKRKQTKTINTGRYTTKDPKVDRVALNRRLAEKNQNERSRMAGRDAEHEKSSSDFIVGCIVLAVIALAGWYFFI